MTRELYQLLVRTKKQAEEFKKEMEETWTYILKTELPPKYYEIIGLIEFCEFLLENEELEDENIK